MKRKSIIVAILILFICTFIFGAGKKEEAPKEKAPKEAVTLHMLMEDVPDTHMITPLLPDFESKTGIKVNFEIVQYLDMHSKLVPQFLSPKASYDVIVVDNYWAGEFPAAGWLEPLDTYVERDKFNISPYIPAMLEMVGYYPTRGDVSKRKLYMIPFYNYTMALIYRTDVITPDLKDRYKKKFGKELKIPPSSMEEYLKVCRFIKDNTNLYGAAMQAGRGDPIVMEWSNYLFALGGDYYDQNWNVTINSPVSLKAIKLYMDNIKYAAPPGALNFNLDDAFRVMAQGEAWSFISYNWMVAALNDPEKSKIVGKVEISPLPEGKSLAGAWGWGIAHNTPFKEEAWKFISWVESYEIAKKRALAGGAPTRSDILLDPEVLKKYPWYKTVEQILARSKPVPEFQYSTQMVEVVGRELSLVGAEGKDPKLAMDDAAKELEELVKKAGLK
jgi:ABC-type glycerol-3-phosphate transport system substrate-binding protein